MSTRRYKRTCPIDGTKYFIDEYDDKCPECVWRKVRTEQINSLVTNLNNLWTIKR